MSRSIVTYHPGSDWPAGWTHDGKHALFNSPRDCNPSRYARLHAVAAEGGYRM